MILYSPLEPTSQKGKEKRRKEPRVFGEFNRYEIQLLSQDSPTPQKGRLLLSDLSPNGMGVFLQNELTPGSQIVIKIIQSDSHFSALRGVVKWCARHNLNSRVLSSSHFSYRAGIELLPKGRKSGQVLLDLLHP